MRHDDAKAREKRGGSGTVGQCRQCSPHVFLAHGEPGAERVRIYTDALKLAKQLLESLFLRHSASLLVDEGRDIGRRVLR